VEAQAEWRVLASAKVLDDCNLPLFSKLVRAVYSDLFGGSEGGFRAAIQSLTERQWLTVVGKDLVATATVYEIHDIQLEPVQANANDHIESISTLLLEDIEWTVPKSARAVVHFISGFSFYNWEAYTKSKKQWRAVLEIDPDNAITHNNYATLLAQQFDGPEKAVGHYEQAIEIDPSYAEAHNNYANLLVRQFGDPEEAARHYETAIENDSDKAEYHLNYANLLKNELCRPEVADTHFDQAIEINPEIPEAHYNYADLLAEQLDRCEAAAEHYEQAIEIEPEYAEAHNNYGLLLRYQLGQFEAAAKHFEQAIDIDSEYAEAHNNYGLLLAEEYNRTETAAKHYKRVIEIDPDIADAHYNYANILFEELDRIEAAAEHYQRAINLNSEIADFHCNYGNLFFEELDRPEAAAEHYERAIDINPEHAEAHNNYAHLLKNKRENLEKAADHLEIAIDTGLDSDEQHSLRRALQGIPAFVSLCEEVGRQEAAIKSCEQALKRIPTASIHDGDRFEHQIQVMYAKITARPASERVPELYQFGLNALCSRAFGPSADLLNEAWGLRDELEDEGKNMAVAAGVWCIGIPDFNIDKEAVKSSEENFEDSSSVVVNALMTAFFTDEDPPTPSQLRQSYSITDSVLELELAAYEALFGINHRLLF
jgi:tetratricopeptide (TPR) repeat protein